MALNGPSLSRKSIAPASPRSVTESRLSESTAIPEGMHPAGNETKTALARDLRDTPDILSGESRPVVVDTSRPPIVEVGCSGTSSADVQNLLKQLDGRINVFRRIVNFFQKNFSPEQYTARKIDKLDMLVKNIQIEVNANRLEWSRESKQMAIDMVADQLGKYIKDLDSFGNSNLDLQTKLMKQANQLLDKIDKVIVPESQFESLTPEGVFTEDRMEMGDQHYAIGAQIGQGTFGKVYRCVNEATGETGVVKFMLVSEMTVGTIDALREVYTTQQFAGHKHIIAPSAVAITAMDDNEMQKLAIVMPEADQGDMENVVKKLADKPLAERTPVFLKLLTDAADGLAEMHRKGFVHRDIKPGNIFVKTNDSGGPSGMIGDLGISRHESDFGSLEMGGTMPYMPADASVGFSVDSYAFGMMAFELLSGGSFPFLATPEAVFDGKSALAMPDPTVLRERIDARLPTASDSVKSLIQKSLSAVPEERPKMSEWLTVLASQERD